MVSFARKHSPFYRDLYQHLPDRVEDSTLLPVTDKNTLMADFDRWVTDPDLHIEDLRPFVDDPNMIGVPFREKYSVVTTSGTTGTRGIFLFDSRSFAIVSVLALRALGSWLTFGDLARIVFKGGRMAMVMASGGHFASAVAAAGLRKRSKWHAKTIQAFPVGTPMPELVAQLNRFMPAILAPYASTAALLATEQEHRRLNINPVLITLAAEGLPEREYARIAAAFRAKVGNSYAASECPFLSYSCKNGWLHVNSDWVIVEPVDRDHRPVAPGQASHTVLISNLANRIQPILRYDLGDSVVQKPEPCECGNPLLAIKVSGRSADVLIFANQKGGQVSIAPLAFGVLVDRIPGIELFQLVQTNATTLRPRMRVAPNIDQERVWQQVFVELKMLLGKHGLDHVTIERAQEPPAQTTGGKYRQIIPMPSA